MLLAVQADARALPFRDASVQCVVTSPPYFGLRDYGTARWEGGDPACDHTSVRREGGAADRFAVSKQSTSAGSSRDPIRSDCRKCGAHRIDQQIGLEPTIDAYVAQLVTVFREVWRCLKPDGVCWLNLGDSYAGGNTGGEWREGSARADGNVRGDGATSRRNRNGMGAVSGLKPKDLCMIPARVALALQADGWYLRSEIVWSKPNPMPESVTDRPTKAHEMIYLLAKSPAYYFDADAVREPSIYAGKVVTLGDKSLSRGQATGAGVKASGNGLADSVTVTSHRNIRSVWHIATQPYAGAHFATMPERLVERCILAGSRAGDIIGDPFVGSGTVARVALRLGRRAVVSDLNPQYFPLIDDRTRVTFGLPFVEDDAAITL